jgi:hypothetical protein
LILYVWRSVKDVAHPACWCVGRRENGATYEDQGRDGEQKQTNDHEQPGIRRNHRAEDQWQHRGSVVAVQEVISEHLAARVMT